MPAGIRKPKQKASVEGTPGKIATAIIARLRNETFYGFEGLKAAVAKKLYEFNHERFQKREGSRYDAYPDEKPFLHPLPSVPYEIATWIYGRKVNIDYHVVFEYNRYSCPHQYAGKTYLACALGKEACLNHVRVRYIRLPDLLMEYGDSTAVAGKQRKMLEHYSRIPLLILDEWLVSDISDSELHYLFEL